MQNIYYSVQSNNKNSKYHYFLILDSNLEIQHIRFNMKPSNADYKRTFITFTDTLKTKPLLYFYPQDSFIISKDKETPKDKEDKTWSEVRNSFEKIQLLSTENYPDLNILLDQINEAFLLTLNEANSWSLLEPQKNKNITIELKNKFSTFYKSIRNNSKKLVPVQETINNQDISLKLYLDKIYALENLLTDAINLKSGAREHFEKTLSDSKGKASLFDNFEKNQYILNGLFETLKNLEKVLIHYSPTPQSSEKTFISKEDFDLIMMMAGNSCVTTDMRTYPINRSKLRILYFLLFITGLKVNQLVTLTFEDITKLLNNESILINKKNISLINFNKEEYLSLEIEKDLDRFFIENNYKYLGCTSFKKDKPGDLNRLIRILNLDIEHICSTMKMTKFTTHSFRYTYIQNLLKHKTFCEIESGIPSFKNINRKSYL